MAHLLDRGGSFKKKWRWLEVWARFYKLLKIAPFSKKCSSYFGVTPQNQSLKSFSFSETSFWVAKHNRIVIRLWWYIICLTFLKKKVYHPVFLQNLSKFQQTEDSKSVWIFLENLCKITTWHPITFKNVWNARLLNVLTVWTGPTS